MITHLRQTDYGTVSQEKTAVRLDFVPVTFPTPPPAAPPHYCAQ